MQEGNSFAVLRLSTRTLTVANAFLKDFAVNLVNFVSLSTEFLLVLRFLFG